MYHTEDKTPKSASERVLYVERESAFHYGSSMIRFARAYHEIKLLEAVGALPLCEIAIGGYPANLSFKFIQQPNEPRLWKDLYAHLRREGWLRHADLATKIEKTCMTLFLQKQLGEKEDDDLILAITVSFPSCKVELVKMVEEVVQRPVYNIVCEGDKLEDPEPQIEVKGSLDADLAPEETQFDDEGQPVEQRPEVASPVASSSAPDDDIPF